MNVSKNSIENGNTCFKLSSGALYSTLMYLPICHFDMLQCNASVGQKNLEPDILCGFCYPERNLMDGSPAITLSCQAPSL